MIAWLTDETVGLALIDGKEIDAMGHIIHTPEDTIDKIHADDIEKAFRVLENLIRFVDKQ